jgi:tetratricopeptide (TPR) repeat protein
VARAFLLTVLVSLVPAMRAQSAPQQQPPPAPTVKEEEPPEEDDSLKPKEYALNPLQAAKEVTAGNFYFKKGNTRAAAKRYLEATRWDPGSAEAFYKLGESSEKLHDYGTALEAYTKYLELAKDAKGGDALRKRIAKWPSPSDSPKTDPAKSEPPKK